jgi:GNAT superfamily N-acetyltransferase
MLASHDEPDERRARLPGRASFRIAALAPDDPDLLATLREWDWVARSLLTRGAVCAATRPRLEDSRRIVGELCRVLAGEEEGEGVSRERLVFAARAGGRVQAVVALFACPRSVFVELLATAPWNLLGPGDPADARTVRGAGTTLVNHASTFSRRLGRGGRVALQAENPRALALYERLGFQRMQPSDAPLALVPRGEDGWSPAVLRLAQKKASREDAQSPWMLLDPERPPRLAAVPARGRRTPAASRLAPGARPPGSASRGAAPAAP